MNPKDLNELAEREVRFLRDVEAGRKPTLACRKEDRARQKLRRMGLVEFVKNPARWQITEAGAASLRAIASGEG